MKLSNKVCVITGGHRGIGRASAELMSREGATVVIADIIENAPADAAPGLVYRRLDVGSPADWDALGEELESQYGRVDVLVNAAGITQTRSGIHDIDLDEWQRIIDVNQSGTMLGMRMAIRMMLDKGPCSIINISSIWGYVAGSGQLAYHASKGAVSVMTRNAAVTYAKHGIRVNAILPGLIETEMVRDQEPAMRAETLAATPMGRIGQPEEIAKGALFLACADSSYVTGVLLPIDGGFTAQ